MTLNYPGTRLLLLMELVKKGLVEGCELNEFKLFPLLNAGVDVGNVSDAETAFVKPGSTLPFPRPKLLIFVPVITVPWGEPYSSWLSTWDCAWLKVCIFVGVIPLFRLLLKSWLLFTFGVDKT